MGGVVVRRVALVKVGQGVAEAAAARETVGAVGQIAEETVSFSPHLGREVCILGIGEVIVSVRQQGHGLHGESKDVVVPLLVEPVHEMLLEP